MTIDGPAVLVLVDSGDGLYWSDIRHVNSDERPFVVAEYVRSDFVKDGVIGKVKRAIGLKP